MPTVNIYHKERKPLLKLQPFSPKLKAYLSEKLSCGDIKLTPSEISVRFIYAGGSSMIGDLELEITAHAFPERVAKQDQICLDTIKYIMKEVPFAGNVKVWLKLCELGHSW